MKTITANHFIHYPLPGRLRGGLGGGVAFVTKRASLADNRYDSALWLYRAGRLAQLTGYGALVGFCWQDKDHLLLVRKAEGGTRLQVLPLHGPGEALDYLNLEQDVEDLAALPHGRLLLVLCHAPEKAGDCMVTEDLPVWDNGQGFVGGARSRLYLWNGERLAALTDADHNVEELRVAADGQTAWLIMEKRTGVCRPQNRLMRLDLNTLALEDFSMGEGFRHDHCLPLADGTALAAGSDMKAYGLNQNAAYYRVGPAPGQAALLNGEGLYGSENMLLCDLSMAGPVRFAARGGKAYWPATVGSSTALLEMDVAGGAMRVATAQPGAVLEVAEDGGQLYLLALRGQGGPELYTLDENGTERCLSALNTQIAAEHPMVAPQAVPFVNAAGHAIDGWVLRPAGLAEDAKCPGVLCIHGGPRAAYGTVAFHEMQLLAARGFAVLFCNPRGSDGRGDAFADIRGQLGGIDYEDLMGFVDAALAQNPWIDAERLGVSGGSYGGFMVNWIIGHTQRFKAAASQRSISNWISMAYTADVGYYLAPDLCGGDVLAETESAWAQSPLKYAAAVRTPTLFIHSEADWRCPWPEAVQFYTALRLNGVDARLCLFGGENHDLSRSGKPQNRVRRLEEIVGWFEKYL